MICGLLGRTLKHSYSPQIHAYFGDYDYQLFEKEPDQVETFLLNGDFNGLNVTIPYKKAVIPYCQHLTPIARRLGAVNTIVKQQDGSLTGHNSDYYGFRSLVERTNLDITGKKALVLGSGGASVTAVAVLEDLGATATVISRNGENNYDNLYLHKDTSVIVNATPVGMYPDTQATLIDLDVFPNLEGVFDLIYNPARTPLLQAAETKGLIAENGLWMLVAQAKESAEFFLGHSLSDDALKTVYKALKFQMENIILIGMPGAGKTTICKEIARKLARPFYDIDQEIVKNSGYSIPEIFANQGEIEFRRLETEAIAAVCKESGLIIATGGGCVTQARNYPLLHQNGTTVWLQRDIASLPTDGRPLSQRNKLEDLFTARKPLYERFADFAIKNDQAADKIAEEIIQIIKEDHKI